MSQECLHRSYALLVYVVMVFPTHNTFGSSIVGVLSTHNETFSSKQTKAVNPMAVLTLHPEET